MIAVTACKLNVHTKINDPIYKLFNTFHMECRYLRLCVGPARVPAAAARVCLHMSGSFSFLTTESDIARWVNRCNVGKQNDCLKSPTEEDLGHYYVSYIILNVRSVDSAHM